MYDKKKDEKKKRKKKKKKIKVKTYLSKPRQLATWLQVFSKCLVQIRIQA